MGNDTQDHTLGALSLTAGAATTTLTLSHASSVTFNGITVTGSAGHSAAVTGSPVRIATGGNVSVPGDVTLTLQSVMNGTGALNKTGVGTVALPAGVTHTYNGATTVSAGTLLVNGTLDTAANDVTVNGTGTLDGTGTINRLVDVQSGGTLAPGTDGTTGELKVTGTVTFESGSTFKVDVNGTDADKLAITGAASIVAGANLVFNVSTLAANEYVIATATGGGLNSKPFTYTAPPGYMVEATSTQLSLKKVGGTVIMFK